MLKKIASWILLSVSYATSLQASLNANDTPLPIENQFINEVCIARWAMNRQQCDLLTAKLRIASDRPDYEEMISHLYSDALLLEPQACAGCEMQCEGLIVEPTHQLLLETSIVQILEVVIPPGYMQAYHTHNNAGIGVDLVPSDFILYKDGEEIFLPSTDDPVFMHSERQSLHATKNVGNKTYRGLHFVMRS